MEAAALNTEIQPASIHNSRHHKDMMKIRTLPALSLVFVFSGCVANPIKVTASGNSSATVGSEPAAVAAGSYKDYDMSKLKIMGFGLGSSFSEINNAINAYAAKRPKQGQEPLNIEKKALSPRASKFDEAEIITIGSEGKLGFVTVRTLYDAKSAYFISQGFSSTLMSPNAVISSYLNKFGQPSYTYRPLKNSTAVVYLNWDFNTEGKQYFGAPAGSPCNGAFSPFANRKTSIQPFYQLYGVADRSLDERKLYGDKDLAIMSIPTCKAAMVLRITMDISMQGDMNKTGLTGYGLALVDANRRLEQQNKLIAAQAAAAKAAKPAQTTINIQ